MNQVSLRMGFESKTYHYLVSLLKEQGIKPDPKYSLSPHYRNFWAMTETGKLLGEPIGEWEKLLNKEITRLDDNRRALEKMRADDKLLFKSSPQYQAIMAAQAEIDNALNARI